MRGGRRNCAFKSSASATEGTTRHAAWRANEKFWCERARRDGAVVRVGLQGRGWFLLLGLRVRLVRSRDERARRAGWHADGRAGRHVEQVRDERRRGGVRQAALLRHALLGTVDPGRRAQSPDALRARREGPADGGLVRELS